MAAMLLPEVLVIAPPPLIIVPGEHDTVAVAVSPTDALPVTAAAVLKT